MKTITTPQSWADVNLYQYLRWYRAVKPYNDTEEYSDKAILHAIFNFTNITEDEYLNTSEKEITKLRMHFAALLSKTYHTLLPKSITIDGVKYGFIPSFDDMSYGEYLDLVAYTKKNMWESMPIIMAILYRPIISESGKTYTIEKYNGTNEDRVELFSLYMTMENVFGTLGFFLDLQNLFTGDVENNEEKRISATDGFSSKWSGYHTIAILTGNDILKFDSITGLPIHQCLTYLSYLKDYNEVQLQASKQNQSIK